MFCHEIHPIYRVESAIKIHFQVYKKWENWCYGQIIFPDGFARQGVLNRDPTVCLDGARPPPKYVCKY
jgi:hypothetical protein